MRTVTALPLILSIASVTAMQCMSGVGNVRLFGRVGAVLVAVAGEGLVGRHAGTQGPVAVSPVSLRASFGNEAERS